MDQARQQVVETIKGHNNVLVTVSTNPSVDELSAALGLTILLDNMEKRSATIFSGSVPPAISFLEPEKTFENIPDSLRDFIIALDKEKADHLRYKVEGESVKIFITPYRTTLTQADLELTQGDYNVELVIALGVKDQTHLDKALEAHGKILHDATVVTITAGKEGGSNLGSLNWHDQAASSLCEMVAGLAEAMKGDKKTLLDQHISTALLTGIVSSTDRFSNDRTSSRVMTIAAQLMATGANQQLIAAKLEEAHDITPPPVSNAPDQGTVDANNSSSEQTPESSNELTIERTIKAKTLNPLAEPLPQPEVLPDVPPPVGGSEEQVLAETPVEQPAGPPAPEQPQEVKDQLDLEKQLAGLTGNAAESTEDIKNELKDAVAQSEQRPAPVAEQPVAPDDSLANQPVQVSDASMPGFEPSVIPGTAPESQVPADVNLPEQPVPTLPQLPPAPTQPPEIINEHGNPAIQPTESASPINGIQTGTNNDEAPRVDLFDGAPNTVPGLVAAVQPLPPGGGTPEGAALLGGTPPVAPPIAPMSQPSGIPQLPPLPPMPDAASVLPPPPPLPPPPQMPAAPLTPQGPMPSGAVSGDVFGDGGNNASTPPPPQAPPEPGQFQIPGQPPAA